MHFLNRQCIFTCIGLVLISLGAVLAVFWMDIFRSILAKVRLNEYSNRITLHHSVT